MLILCCGSRSESCVIQCDIYLDTFAERTIAKKPVLTLYSPYQPTMLAFALELATERWRRELLLPKLVHVSLRTYLLPICLADMLFVVSLRPPWRGRELSC